MSEGFTLTRVVRLGCPLSYLFVITVEILAIAIRYYSKIKHAIHIKEENKINQYADDTALSVVVEDESLVYSLTR